MNDLPIVAAGREVPDALDRVRRYCGLAWSGGQPETWAWHYFDAVATPHDDVVAPTDVVCAASLHPGLTRDDLAYFREESESLTSWLRMIPVDARLWELTDAQLRHLATLPELDPPSLSLTTKVLHRKRPHSVPLLDRHVIDWYRPVTHKRAATEAWGPLIETMGEEEQDDERRLLFAIAAGGLESELWPDLAVDDRPRMSWLRIADIAIWMGSR